MNNKVVKKKSSSRKKKTLTLKKSAVKKKTVKKKSPIPKKRTLKKKVVKKKSPAPKKRTPKKKVVKKKSPAPKKRTLKKKIVKKKSLAKGLSKAGARTLGLNQSEKYMNPRQLEYFKNILLARRRELIEEADRTADYIQADSNTYADTIDQANQEEEFTLQLKERERERKLLQKIDEALVKIDERKYGFCISCGAEIGISRLKARPTTDQCIDCKELDEIRERY